MTSREESSHTTPSILSNKDGNHETHDNNLDSLTRSGPPHELNQEALEATMMRTHGIDFQEALSILSSRSAPEPVNNLSPHTINHESGSGGRGGQCGCTHGMEITQGVSQMGQTIDWMAPAEGPQEEPKMSSQEEQERERRVEVRSKRLQKIQSELKSMSNHELLQAVLQVQEERVATYRDYEG